MMLMVLLMVLMLKRPTDRARSDRRGRLRVLRGEDLRKDVEESFLARQVLLELLAGHELAGRDDAGQDLLELCARHRRLA